MFGSFYFCLDDIKERFVSAYRLFIWVDGCHLKTAETKTHRFLNGSRRQWLKPTNFEHYGTYLQQKKLYGQKPKNRELTETKMIFKPRIYWCNTNLKLLKVNRMNLRTNS
jgi:hypothetical protein